MLEIRSQSVTVLDAKRPIDMVEYAARVCYDSIDKRDQAKTADFVRNLIKRGHCTPLEHAYVRVYPNRIDDPSIRTFAHTLHQFAAPADFPFADRRLTRGAFYRGKDDDGIFVCGNLRDIMWYIGHHCDPIDFVQLPAVIMDPYYMVLDIITDRGIATEFFRHRTMAYDDDGYEQGYKSLPVDFVPEMSLNQQSTRYVNFDKKPVYIIRQEPAEWAYNDKCMEYSLWYCSCEKAIHTYSDLLQLGVTPEFARSVLPLSLGTRVIMSGSIVNWLYLLNLRLPKGAHPMARHLAAMIWEKIKANPVWYGKAEDFLKDGMLDKEFNAADFDREANDILTLVKQRRGDTQ